MIQRVGLALLVAMAICTWSFQADAYPGGGDPTEPLSCYGDCAAGRSPSTGTPSCFCDEACNARGDCCADRNEFCSPSVARPACSLSAPNGNGNFCGTDLGFIYQHNGVLELLFGDSWYWPASNPSHTPLAVPNTPVAGECTSRGILGLTDDVRGQMSVARPSTAMGIPQRAAHLPALPAGDNCGAILTIDREPANPSNIRYFKLLDTNGVERPMPPAFTPLAAFSDGTSAYGVFSAVNPNNLLSVYIAKRDAGNTATYRVVKNLGEDSKFLNSSVARITSYDGTNPNTASNFTTPTNGGVMLLFGRPRFLTSSFPVLQSVDTNGIYLVRHNLPLNGGPNDWQPQYFVRLGPTGNPEWSPNESDARPMFTQDFKVVENIDIKWVPQMGKWIMLYGGDIEWYFFPDYPRDQPRSGAIHMRLADYPWGPWSRATPLLWREDMGNFMKCDATDLTSPTGCDQRDLSGAPWNPGDFISGRPTASYPQCRTDLQQPVQPNACGLIRHQRGELYSANLIPTWTNPDALNLNTLLKTTTIYFTVSTWMPYQVRVAVADIKLPVNIFGQFKIQLRELNGKMISTASTSTPTNTAGVPETSWFVTRVPNDTTRGPRVGDTVVFTGVRAGQSVWLARSGHNVVYLTATGAPPRSAQWRLDPAESSAPAGTPIVLGQTHFKLISASSLDENAQDPTKAIRALKSTAAEGLRAYGGGGTTSWWSFSNGCLLGDKCPR